MTTRRAEPNRASLLVVAGVLLVCLVAFWPRGRSGEPAPAGAQAPARDPGSRQAATASSDALAAARARADREALPPSRLGIAIQGLVLDRNGRPVEGVHVRLNGPGDADHERRSDAQGRFEADGLVAGSYQIIATGPHLLTHHEFARLAASDELVELTLDVDTGVPVVGQVVDEDQRPVANAKVTPWRRGPTGEELEAEGAVTTDGAGRFELRGAPGSPTYVLVEYRGYPPTRGRLQPTRLAVVVIRRSE